MIRTEHPLAKWCHATFIQKKVARIIANENKLELVDGSIVEYDILGINVGSKTKGTMGIPGVYEYSLTTRPIDDLIPKIQKKEQELLQKGITPSLVVWGAGCAGVELSFGFKNRWQKFFKKDHIETTLLSGEGSVLPNEKIALRKVMENKLTEQNINVHSHWIVSEVTKNGVKTRDRREFKGNVVVWGTGAEPQAIIQDSDLEMSKGYFRVNEHLQSTSHPNVFAAGDCITMKRYENLDKPFPPKAGVYAVREGPLLANNIAHYIKKEKLESYAPQPEFLALLMTGNLKAVGTKFGFSFNGKWVWNMKDYIDVGFMKLFDPKYLFKDYENKGTAEPLEHNALFEEELKAAGDERTESKNRVAKISVDEAVQMFKVSEDHEEFLDQFMILERMKSDIPFKEGIMKALA